MSALDEAVTDVVGPSGEKLNVTDFARKWTHQVKTRPEPDREVIPDGFSISVFGWS